MRRAPLPGKVKSLPLPITDSPLLPVCVCVSASGNRNAAEGPPPSPQHHSNCVHMLAPSVLVIFASISFQHPSSLLRSLPCPSLSFPLPCGGLFLVCMVNFSQKSSSVAGKVERVQKEKKYPKDERCIFQNLRANRLSTCL